MLSDGSLSRPFSVTALVAVQALLAVMAIPSGALLLADPSGAIIGGQFVLQYLSSSLPFTHDFIPVGVWLALPVLWVETPVVLLAMIRLWQAPAPLKAGASQP